MKNIKKFYQSAVQHKIGRLILMLSFTGIFFIISPIIFGSMTLSLKLGIVSLLPFFTLCTASLMCSVMYGTIILPALSQITGWMIWVIFAKLPKYTPLDGYLLDDEIERNPRKTISSIKYMLHRIILCGGIAFYIHYNYALLVSHTITNFALAMAVGFLWGSALGMQRNIKPYEKHVESYMGKFIIGGITGLTLTISQLTFGFYIGHHIFELGYIGSGIGMTINFLLVDVLYIFAEAVILKIYTTIDDLMKDIQTAIIRDT